MFFYLKFIIIHIQVKIIIFYFPYHIYFNNYIIQIEIYHEDDVINDNIMLFHN